MTESTGTSPWHLIRRYALTERHSVLALSCVVFSAMAARVSLPYLTGLFIDEAGSSASLTRLITIGVAFLVLGLIDQVLTFAGARLSADIGLRVSNTLRADMLGHALRLDLDYHADNSPGELLERIDGDARELNELLSQFGVNLAGNLLTVAGTLVVLFVISWPIGLVMAGFAAVALTVFARLRNSAAPYWHRAREATARMYGVSEEYFAGLDDVRGNGAVTHAVAGIDATQRELFQRQRRATAMSAIVGSGAELVLTLGMVAILGVAVALYVHGSMSIGDVVTVSLFGALINQPLQNIVEQIDDVQRAAASVSRVDELLSELPSIRDGSGTGFPGPILDVEFDDVTMRYPKSAGVPALRGVSLRVSPGDLLAIVGRTGSGKSTIARLLLRLYDPAAGQIRVGGQDIRDVTVAELRRHIGIVTQEVTLFQLSLRDNLTMFDDSVPDERLAELISEVGLGPWFSRLPAGLDTVLESGGGLSAGEGQLLAAVRVFVADPEVVVLDEPTSRLDPVTEDLIARAFDRLTASRTALIIAHRLETVSRADKVLVLDGGEVAEFGDRAALAADPSSRLYRMLRTADLISEAN